MRTTLPLFSPLASRGEGGTAGPGASLTRTLTRNNATDFGRAPFVNQAYNLTPGASYGRRQPNEGTDISRPIPVAPGVSVTVTFAGPMNVFGFTYDAAGAPLAPIRDAALFGTKLSSYTFTTPAGAASFTLYTRASELAGALTVTGFLATATQTRTYTWPIDPDNFTGIDSVRLGDALELAGWVGRETVHCRRDYLLTQAALVPSTVTLLLHGCTLRLADGTHDNIVRAACIRADGSVDPEGAYDIRILGVGNATLQGSNEAWGGDQPTAVPGDQAWRSIGLHMANVTSFVVDGITFRDTNSWASCFEQCQYGRLTNLVFDQRGSRHNQDGIDLRRGTHDVLIENLSGGTYDDFVALTNLVAYPNVNALTPGVLYGGRTNLDIYNVTIRNLTRRVTALRGSGFPAPHYWGGLLLLCEDGLKIHDVTIDGVTGPQQIYLGFDSENYGFSYAAATTAQLGDMYNIHISNTNQAPIYIKRRLRDCSFTNVAPLDVTGGYAACVPVAGSLRIARKYHNAAPEYLATV